eukprot:Hpha_TRINITY_DN33528_c0_g1::TRINITY_DN33528_c0_g1_i1::g.171169::m.171169
MPELLSLIEKGVDYPFVPTPFVEHAEPCALAVTWTPGDAEREWDYNFQWQDLAGAWVQQLVKEPPVRCAGLRPASTHVFRMCARITGTEKWGPYSSEVKLSTPYTIPERLETGGVEIVTTQHSAEVTWTPLESKTDRVQRYRAVLRRVGASEVWEEPPGPPREPGEAEEEGEPEVITRHNTCKFEGLTGGSDFCVFISLLNTEGIWNAFTPPVLFRTQTGIPARVKVSEIRSEWRMPREMRLYWGVPNSRGSPILHYEAQCIPASIVAPAEGQQPDEFSETEYPPTLSQGPEPAVNIRDLVPDCLYSVRVRGRNANGHGEWSLWAQFCTVCPPLASGVELVKAEQDALLVRWNKLSTRGYCVTHFLVEFRRVDPRFERFDQLAEVPVRKEDRESHAPSDFYSYNIHPLPPAAHCQIRLRCRAIKTLPGASAEVSDPGPVLDTKTLPGWPGQVVGLRLTSEKMSDVTSCLTYDTPANHGSEIMTYELQLQDMPGNTLLRTEKVAGDATTCRLDAGDLKSGARYAASVRAANALGFGPWSTRLDFVWGSKGASLAAARDAPAEKNPAKRKSRIARLL